MKTLEEIYRKSGGIKLLCLGAHSDDIEIGCGGTILKLIKLNIVNKIHWTVFAADEMRKREAEASANAFLKDVVNKKIELHQFRDGYFPYLNGKIKDAFEGLKENYEPDIIFTHYRNDLHQDHRHVNELTWNTFRNHLIFEYEIPKYDGDIGNPNYFVPIDDTLVNTKIHYLNEYFASQANKHWFDHDLFKALLRLRGMECSSPSHYAEAFYCRKMVWL